MAYEQVVHHAHTWGLVLLTAIFAGVVLYALWPGNRERFKLAAQTPLESEEDDG